MEQPLTLGSYRLIAELGHGGMADVFLAAVEGPAGSGFTKLAVIKKLRSHLAEDPEFVQMLMDEARITARLSHPNVVQLFEMGQVDDHYFLAMEYLEGQPLHRIERRASRYRPDMPRELYYAAVSDMLAGLHHAHELADYDGTPLEIVHRDVTPHNVFVTYDGAVKVVDFGIAKAVGRATETRQGMVKGKFRYMSPEQATGKVVDRRTDVFAAGVILFHAATNTKLWADCDDAAVARGLAKGNYSGSPRAIRPDVPEEIDRICQKALAFRREDRYATAAEMQGDLERFLGGGTAAARKELASTVRELFEADRAQVRTVLEGARLTSNASLRALNAAIGAPESAHMRAQHDSGPPEPGDHTELMPGAPAHPPPPPRPELASVSAMATSAAGSPGAARVATHRATGEPPGQQPARSPFVVGSLLFATALVVLAFAARAARPAGDSANPRPVASLALELTTSSLDVRLKDDHRFAVTPPPPPTAPPPPPPVTGAKPGAKGEKRPPVPPQTPVATPAPAAPRASGSAKKPTPAPLDGTDPWGKRIQ